jgi:hypothetical protein
MDVIWRRNMAMADTPDLAPVAIASDNDHSYVDWSAIFAGTVLASAISFVLLTFGSAIGLSLTSAYEGRGMSLFWFSIAAVLWVLWVQISSFLAGGYLTGRMRRRHYDATEHESDIRDGSHGLVMWGFAVLLGAVIAFSGVSAVVSTATGAASTVAAGAAAGAAGNVDELGDANGILVDRLLRSATPSAEPVAPSTRDEIGRILASSLGEGALSDADKQYLVGSVAARTGVDEAQAQQRVDELWAQAQQAEAKVRDAADAARRIGMLAAFMTAASLLVSAAAAYFGATLGGNHRDAQVAVAGWMKPW